MKGRKILIATPLLKWYLKHGLKVTNIYQVVEFKPKRCFNDFEKEVTAARRAGDRDPTTNIIADTMKLIGNSAYGSLIMDKEKHQSVRYVKSKKEACDAVNQPTFRKITELDDELYEIESAKKKILLNLPIYLGYYILQYAKLRMLEFYYDFFDEYVDRSDFDYIEMDTDSAYAGISAKTLEEIIKPSKKAEFHDQLYNHCYDEYYSSNQWFPRECCERHKLFDKRTPGVFKLEAEGDEMVALSSKTYLLILDLLTEKYKISSKGVNPKAIIDPIIAYQEVLRTQKPKSGRNKGFRIKNNTIYTYEQDRAGLTYLYPKRIVLSDGVNTSPLDITLSPWNIPEHITFSGNDHPLSLEYPCRISVFGSSFGSAREAYNFILCTENKSAVKEFVEEKKMKFSVDWLENRKNYMKEILLEKMRTNTMVRKFLKKSGDLPLLNAVYNRYWGIGMGPRLARVCNSHRGANALGEVWGEIREIYYKEVQIEQAERCESCESRRSDVKWNRDSEENLCTYCAPLGCNNPC